MLSRLKLKTLRATAGKLKGFIIKPDSIADSYISGQGSSLFIPSFIGRAQDLVEIPGHDKEIIRQAVQVHLDGRQLIALARTPVGYQFGKTPLTTATDRSRNMRPRRHRLTTGEDKFLQLWQGF